MLESSGRTQSGPTVTGYDDRKRRDCKALAVSGVTRRRTDLSG